jgi:hypothetical protein
LETVASLDDKFKQNEDALRENINKAWQAKEQEWTATRDKLEDKLYDATVGSKFAKSAYIKEDTLLHPDVAKSFFGKHFAKDGTAVGHDGNPIYSIASPGEKAGFEESIKILVETSPIKDQLIKSKQKPGTGGAAASGNRGNAGGGAIKRSAADKIRDGLKARA